MTIEYLNLSCNHIEQVPELNLPRLVYLDISCNLISSLNSFSFLTALRSLSISYNLIKSIEEISKMMNLFEIDIEHNLIDSIQDFMPLFEDHLLVFIIKNNPAAR